MKLQSKILFAVAVFVLAIPLVAGAARYKGDGATQNATNGGWDLPAVSSHVQCLECHGQTPYHSAPDKSSYLLTGHRNILRKVTPGKPWAGPDGVIYTADGSGNPINWTTGRITVSGSAYPLFYIFGDWMAPALDYVCDKGGGKATTNVATGGGYTCARCHTTGYAATGSSGVGSNGATEPSASFPTITSGITGYWWFDGIQCERCHKDDTNDYGGHNCYVNGVLDPKKTNHTDCVAAGGTYSVNVPTGASSTARCSECHLSTAAWENSANNPNYATQPTAYPLGASASSFTSHRQVNRS